MKLLLDAEIQVRQVTTNYKNESLQAHGSIVAMGRDESPIDVQFNIPLNKEAFSEALHKMKNNELDVPSVELALAMVQTALARRFALSIKDET